MIFIGGKMLYFGNDSSIIIQNLKSDFLLTKLNLKDKSIINLIPLGNGANEFIHINVSQKTSDSTFIFQDMNSANLYQANIYLGLINKIFPYKNPKCMEIAKMNNDFIATGLFSEGMFAIYNNDTLQNYIYKYPKDNISDDKMAYKAMAYQGKLLINEEKNSILFSSYKHPYFEIFKIINQDLISIKKSYTGNYKYEIPTDESMFFAHQYEDNTEGYIDAYATNKRIYLLYSGRSIKDIDVETHEKASLSNTILVYDWEGCPIIRYNTDIDLKKICVNDAENIIYAIAYDPNPEIVFFKL